MVCIKCKAVIPDDVSFCPKCGSAVMVEKRCPKCGNTVGADINFCTKCGTQLTGQAPVDYNSAPVVNSAALPVKRSGFRWWYGLAAIFGVVLLLFLGKMFVGPGVSKNPGGGVYGNDANENTFTNGTWTSEPAEAVTLSFPGDYEVSMLSARTSHIPEGRPCIVVKFSFTNKSNYEQNFLDAVFCQAYQNDNLVAPATEVDDPIYNEKHFTTKNISSGETMEVEWAFHIPDLTTPVILIQMEDRGGSTKVQKKFTFEPDN